MSGKFEGFEFDDGGVLSVGTLVALADHFKKPDADIRMSNKEWENTGDRNIIAALWQCSPGDVVMDIGFGPGMWSLSALSQGAFVYSFDPAFEAVKLLTGKMVQ